MDRRRGRVRLCKESKCLHGLEVPFLEQVGYSYVKFENSRLYVLLNAQVKHSDCLLKLTYLQTFVESHQDSVYLGMVTGARDVDKDRTSRL